MYVICTQLNDFKYYLELLVFAILEELLILQVLQILIILFNINHLFAHS